MQRFAAEAPAAEAQARKVQIRLLMHTSCTLREFERPAPNTHTHTATPQRHLPPWTSISRYWRHVGLRHLGTTCAVCGPSLAETQCEARLLRQPSDTRRSMVLCGTWGRPAQCEARLMRQPSPTAARHVGAARQMGGMTWHHTTTVIHAKEAQSRRT